MATVNYELEWRNHSKETIDVLSTLRRENRFADVTILCSPSSDVAENCIRAVPAHKVILAACSGYFYRVFEHLGSSNASVKDTVSANQSASAVLLLPDASFDVVDLAVEFMYSGQVNVPAEKFESFMKLAESLEIRGLKDDSAQPSSKTSTTVHQPCDPEKEANVVEIESNCDKLRILRRKRAREESNSEEREEDERPGLIEARSPPKKCDGSSPAKRTLASCRRRPYKPIGKFQVSY